MFALKKSSVLPVAIIWFVTQRAVFPNAIWRFLRLKSDYRHVIRPKTIYNMLEIVGRGIRLNCETFRQTLWKPKALQIERISHDIKLFAKVQISISWFYCSESGVDHSLLIEFSVSKPILTTSARHRQPSVVVHSIQFHFRSLKGISHRRQQENITLLNLINSSDAL